MYTSLRTLLGFGLFVGMAWHYSQGNQIPKNLDNTDVALAPAEDVAVRTPVEGLSAASRRSAFPARASGENSTSALTLAQQH